MSCKNASCILQVMIYQSDFVGRENEQLHEANFYELPGGQDYHTAVHAEVKDPPIAIYTKQRKSRAIREVDAGASRLTDHPIV
jgi:hypothetical protein